jgi:hypothetical protein
MLREVSCKLMHQRLHSARMRYQLLQCVHSADTHLNELAEIVRLHPYNYLIMF